MCAPIILTDGAMALFVAHLLGVGLLAGVMIINSNNVRKGMSAALGFRDGIISKCTLKG